MSSWRSLRVAPREFSLFSTFSNGQCFCWRRVDSLTWCGVVDQFVYLLRQKPDDVEYRVLNSSTATATTATTATTTEEEREETTLRRLLQLETNMEPLKHRWSSGHQKIHSDMGMILNSVEGMRVLRQDPFECLFSFITSANNNITRINHILQYLRVQWGEHLLTTDESHEIVYNGMCLIFFY